MISLLDLERFDREFASSGVVEIDVFPRTRLAAKAGIAALPLVVLGVTLLVVLLREENLWAAVVAAASGIVFFAANFRLSAARWFLSRYMDKVTRPQFNPDRRRAANISPGDWMLVGEQSASRVAFVDRENDSVNVTLASGAVRVLGAADRQVVGLLIPNVMSPPERAAAARHTPAPH